MTQAIRVINEAVTFGLGEITSRRPVWLASADAPATVTIPDIDLPDWSDFTINFLCVWHRHPIEVKLDKSWIMKNRVLTLNATHESFDIRLTKGKGLRGRARMLGKVTYNS